MLHVTMSAEHSESVWVRNEWSRFLSLIAEGQQKVLIPCYKDMSAYDLPDEMQSLQGQDMSKVGAMQDLVYGIEKIFRKKTNTVEKKEIVEATVGSSSYKGLLKKGYTYLRNGRFDEADSTFDAAIKISEMPGEAYLGKVLAEYQFKTVDEVLETADEVVVDCDNFVMAKEFADEETAKLLKKIEDTLRYNRLKENYDSAMSQYNKGDLENLSLAKDNFIALEDFENSREMVKECTYQMGIAYMSYITSIKALGYCDDATECFEEVIDYKDSKEKINQIGALKEKITSEYKELCISKLSIAYPKTVDYVSLTEVAKKIKDNRTIVFTPNYEEFDSAKKAIEDEAIKFFISKCPAYIQSLNQLNDCERLDRLCSSIETNGNLKTVHELISQREKELKEIAVAIRKKKNKKRLKITGIVCAALAVSVATFFGIKAIVDETNRSNTYNAATSYMESGDYDDAIAYYQSLGDYKESQKKIKVCEGLKQLESSIESKKEEDAIKGIKTIVSAGEKVDVSYETENSVNIKRLAGGGNSGNKTETIETVDFTLYQPTWNGYTFLNWDSESLSYKDNRTYLGMMSNWSLNAYQIIYNLNGGTNATTNPATYTIESEDIVLANPLKKGYSFNGWFDNNDNQVLKIAHGSFGNVTLNARWTANNYTITFNANSGTVNPTSIVVTFDKEYTLPTPTRNYYGFAGWYDDNGNKWADGTYTRDSDLSLTAHWTPDSYTITYNLNNGTNNPSNPSSYTIEDEITFSDPSRVGYHFDGWTDTNGSPITGIPLGSTGPITINANWTINTYTVTFENWDGSVLDTQYVNHGGSVTYNGPVPTKPADAQYTYTHKGWDKSLTNITSDLIITATFDADVNYYTITWKNYDGSTLKTDSFAYGSTPKYTGETPTKPDYLNDHYTFSGWSPSVVSVTGDCSYVAQFSSQPIFTYKKDSYGSSIIITGASITTLEKYEIPTTIDSLPVLTIYANGFTNCKNAKEIVVPDCVTTITNQAFAGCSNLESITIPYTGRSIESHTTTYGQMLFGTIFGENQYEGSTYVLQNTYDNIYYGFYIPSNLKHVTIRNSQHSSNIPAKAFAQCSMIESVEIDMVGTYSIGDFAFTNCSKLETIEFGDNLTSIGTYAFSYCSSLQQLFIPDTTTSIAEYALCDCIGLETLSLPTTSSVDSFVLLDTYTTRHLGRLFRAGGNYEGEVYRIDQRWANASLEYAVPKSLRSVTIRGGDQISSYFFSGFTGLNEINIPDSIEGIGVYSFDRTKIVSINLVNVKAIANNAFAGSSLTSIYLPSIQTIAENAFANCSSLMYAIIGETLGSGYTTSFSNDVSTIAYYLGSSSSTKLNLMFPEERIYYYSEQEPLSSGNYWHYVNNVPKVWSDYAIYDGNGTIDAPYTIDSAAKLISNQTTTYQYTSSEIYVKGVVVNVEYNSVSNDWKIYFNGVNLDNALILKNYKFDSTVFSQETIDYYTGDNASNLIGKTIKFHGYGFKDYPSEQAMVVPNNNVKPTIYMII